MSNSPEDPSKRRKRRVRRSTGTSPSPGSTDHSAFTEGTPAKNLPAPGTSQPSRHDLSPSSEPEAASRLAGFQRTTEDEDLKPKEGGDGRKRERVKEIRKNPLAMPDWDQEEEELSPLDVAREGMEKKEKSRRKRKEEPSPLETFFGKMSKVFYVFAGVVVLTLIALGTWGVYVASKNSEGDVPTVGNGGNNALRNTLSGVTPLTIDELTAAQAAASRFLEAGGYEQKLLTVSDADTAAELMPDWYSRPVNIGTDSAESLGETLQAMRVSYGKRRFVMLAAYVNPTSRIQYFAVEDLGESTSLSPEDPRFKVHWEATVGYQKIGVEEFTSTRQLEPVPFRATALREDYYNGAFSDPTKYVCVKLVYPGNPEFVIWGYADRDSAFTEEFEHRLSVHSNLSICLSLKHLPGQNPTTFNQAEIVSIEAYEWFP